MGKANRGRDTGPERALRSELHRRGLRYRVQRRLDTDPSVTADIVFGPARVAVFVDGCFWHVCPEHGTMPKSNRTWWADKLAANVERDRRTDLALTGRGWTVIRVWEHEHSGLAADRVEAAVRSRRSEPTLRRARRSDDT